MGHEMGHFLQNGPLSLITIKENSLTSSHGGRAALAKPDVGSLGKKVVKRLRVG
ncbi:MAG: hypothetical protein ABTS16_08980 [Candidatus Accumulibacter phosphatis]|jgi:hypothetical protein|uniref:hypothetical protein n=1 Tax=Candidatus Accumulibacter TaxID=327159 RepID=UPI0004B5DE69|nr:MULTISPECIES: hypothetical protein [Candidatus Accumulibacter]MBL8409288.1 hypothetical protein [Accumulibacter sp.]